MATQHSYAPVGATSTLDADEKFLYFWYSYTLRTKWEALKACHISEQKTSPTWLGKTDANNKRWRFPKNRNTLKLILEHFPETTLLDEAKQYKASLQHVYKARMLRSLAEAERQQRELDDLLGGIGGIEAPFGNGKKLFEHQQQCMEIMLRKRRFICGDQTGAGKTYEAAMTFLALQRKYGWPVYILTTKSSRRMWLETAEEIGATVEVFTWAKPPIASNDHPAQPFILVGDEAHNAANFNSAQTQRMLALAWHPHCQAAYMLTGTPYTNGRSINGYPLFLAVRHPMVYVELFPDGVPNYPINWNKLPPEFYRKRRRYENRYCDRKELRKRNGELLLSPSGKTIWDISGTSNAEELAAKTLYIPGQEENDPHAVLIARTKFDCRKSMPAKTRVPVPAEISEEAKAVYLAALIELYEKHEQSIAEKVQAFKELWSEKHNDQQCPAAVAKAYEQRCRRADAMQEYERFRHASAIAMVEHVSTFAEYLLQQSNRLLIYTTFVDAAHLIGERIAQATGRKVGYIYGDVSEDERNVLMKEFQHGGETSVIIFGKAGSEAITLNKAREIIVVDRPWTTGAIDQAEDRGWRITDETPFTSYWEQMPEDVCPAARHVDSILDGKQVNVDLLQYNKHTSGIEFVRPQDLPNYIHQIIKSTVKQIRNNKIVAKDEYYA